MSSPLRDRMTKEELKEGDEATPSHNAELREAIEKIKRDKNQKRQRDDASFTTIWNLLAK